MYMDVYYVGVIAYTHIKMEEEKAKKQQKNESHVETVLPVNNTGQPSSPSIGKLTSIGDVFERK